MRGGGRTEEWMRRDGSANEEKGGWVGETYTLADEILGKVGGEHVGSERLLHVLGEDLGKRETGSVSTMAWLQPLRH